MSKIQNRLILIILFLLPTYLIKIKFGWVSFNVLELLIFVLFLFRAFKKNTKYEIPNTKYVLPIIFIIIGLLLSVLANQNYYSGFGAIKGWFVVPLIFAIIFYDALKKDERLLRKSLLALFFSGAAISLIGIFYKFSGILTYDNRLKIFWDSPNQLAMFLAVPFLIGIEKFGFEELKKVRLWGIPATKLPEGKSRTLKWKSAAIIFGLLLISSSLYLTKSFGVWLAIMMTLLAVFWLEYGKKVPKKYLATFSIILAIFLVWASINKYNNIQNLDKRSSLASRTMIWRSAGLMIENNPLFGIGPGNFQEKYLEYQKYFPPYLEWSAPQPHNLFFAFWLQAGLIGLAGFVWILISFFRDNKIAIRNDRNVGILFLGIMIYILVHGLVDTTYWRNDLAVIFWMMIAANFSLVKSEVL